MTSKNILLTGAAGYIGSHVALKLIEQGFNPIIVDNFVSGHRDFPKAIGAKCYEMCISSPKIRELISEYKIESVMHFAGYSCVGESVNDPKSYFHNNVFNTMALLDSMVACDVEKIVFSSTCAIFGNPISALIDESHPCLPLSPYGQSKLWVEQMLSSYERAYGIRSVCLRYFNAAGADPLGRIGEDHRPESHLLPLCIAAGLSQSKVLKVFGNGYKTIDGTCIRDYIHVLDLAQAHIIGLSYLFEAGISDAFNLGTGQGHSILELIATVSKVLGQEVFWEFAPARMGDPSSLVASSEKAKKILGWQAVESELANIVATAVNWYKKRL